MKNGVDRKCCQLSDTADVEFESKHVRTLSPTPTLLKTRPLYAYVASFGLSQNGLLLCSCFAIHFRAFIGFLYRENALATSLIIQAPSTHSSCYTDPATPSKELGFPCHSVKPSLLQDPLLPSSQSFFAVQGFPDNMTITLNDNLIVMKVIG